MSVFFHALMYRPLLPLQSFSGPQPLANTMRHIGGFIGGALEKHKLGFVQAKLYFKLKYY